MKNKIIGILLIISLTLVVGCNNNTNNKSKKENQNINKEEVKTTLSCYSEGYLFKSKKSVEHIISLNKDNKLIGYQHVEKYFSFTDDDNFNMICEGAVEEEEYNNKWYKFLKQEVDCNKEKKEVTISDVYDIDKLETTNSIPSEELRNNLNDDYILDLENFKTAITNKGYTCK